jgi:ABC-type phosphate transport system ATPase subunit
MQMGYLTEEGAKTEVFMNKKHQKTGDYITGKFG